MLKPVNSTSLSQASKPILWVVFVLYIAVAGYTMLNHEMWGDELLAWNIAKGSSSLLNLIHNTRYEGHPPVWFIILWCISKVTYNLAYVKAVQLVFAILAVFLVLFYAKLPLITKVLIPFGYYFLFEYAVFSRNYTIGVVAAFLICIILKRQFKNKLVLYYALLLLMSNVHLLAMLLAVSLHAYFLLQNAKQKRNTVVLHILLGLIIFLPAAYFIVPPSNSTSGMGFLTNKLTVANVFACMQIPLRAFIPIPAWWEYHFWNTQFLLAGQSRLNILKFIDPFISATIIGRLCFLLRKNKKSLLLFVVNLSLSFIVSAAIFPLTSERYSGFVFIGFLVAYWLYCNETSVGKNQNRIIVGLLFIQLAAGVFAVIKDIRLPFSNSYRVSELLNKAPANERVVTDYWALNTVAAYTHKPFYCIDMQKKMQFILWRDDMAAMAKTKYRYTEGVAYLFNHENIKIVNMVSTGSIAQIIEADPQLVQLYKVDLISKIDGAIEKGSNLYMYQISSP